MSDVREMTDLRELDPVELASVVGGADGFCGTGGSPFSPFHFPPPPPPPPLPWC